jgi:hypothetical protein
MGNIASSDDDETAPIGANTEWGELPDDSVEILDEEELYQYTVFKNDPGKSCCRLIGLGYDPDADFSTQRICELLSNTTTSSLECTLNELRSASYYSCHDDCIPFFTENDRLNILDSFLRGRHENLSKYTAMVVGYKLEQTDVRFSDILPISSKRTPDLIMKLGHKRVLVVEVTAVSDSEKGAVVKGLESKGYKSKYELEIDELKMKGFTVNYVPIIFDMVDIENKDHFMQIKSIADIVGADVDPDARSDLELLRREYIQLTNEFNKKFSDLYNVLFGKAYKLFDEVDLDHHGLYSIGETTFEGRYSKVGISNSMYDRICSLWPRMPNMVRKLEDEKLYILNYDVNRNRFRFDISARGSKKHEWEVAVESSWRVWVCQKIGYKTNDINQQPPRADYEFFDYDKSKRRPKKMAIDPIYREHSKHEFNFEGTCLKDFGDKLGLSNYLGFCSNFEDKDYEEKLIKMIVNDFHSDDIKEQTKKWLEARANKPLAFYDVTHENFKKAVEDFDSAQFNTSNSLGPTVIRHVKQPFIYPIYKPSPNCYSVYSKKPSIINILGKINIGPYTNQIISIIAGDDFTLEKQKKFSESKESSDVRQEIAGLTRERNRLLKPSKSVDGSFKSPDKELIRKVKVEYGQRISILQKKLNSLNGGMLKLAKKSGVVKMTNKNSFKEEMKHFKQKGTTSHYFGIGNEYDPGFVKSSFENLINDLCNGSLETCPDEIYDDRFSFDCKLLTDFKEMTLNNSRSFYNYMKNTNIYAACAFVSRLCHTLMYQSQTTMNSDWVSIDNLGYDDVLLMVRGGKKVFPTKRSKMFRLIYPTYQVISNLHGINSGMSDHKEFIHNGKVFIITPWMNMNETLMVDGLTALHRLMGFTLLNCDRSLENTYNLEKVIFNILLALHNRRKTEQIFHNLRYIMLNCMSELSAIPEMLKEAAGFNYDYFQCWIRNSIHENFFKFASSMKEMHDMSKAQLMKEFLKEGKLTHLITDVPIDSFETLATAVYSTYLMSKAPTTQALEQVSNLNSMMKTHVDFLSREKGEISYRVSAEGSFGEYYDKLFSSDFCYDPKYCTLLGKFMADYLDSIEPRAKTCQKWDQILDQNWDEFANTKGLRYEKEDFFGCKGYYVVYKELLLESAETNSLDKLLDIINGDIDDDHKRKEMDNLNQSFRKRIGSKKLKKVVMHVVDKKQRSGPREIFVMDLETKVHQQVIEGYMAHLCKLIPDEMISIPSNKRLSTIHSRVFEDSKDTDENHYWVLDCRKWAPKSLIEKFMIFLVSAKSYFPSSFIKHCLSFFKKATRKQIYTRKPIFDIFSKSKTNDAYKIYFNDDNENGGVYFVMEYSWVMGIFNYFSSLFHVACQLHSSHIIRLSTKNMGLGDNILHMMAHSDDSAGKFQTSSPNAHKIASIIYETLMHASNHLISRKKSCKGKVYFELLSVLYIGGELLSLLDKFIGIFNFHPTDKGYCSDINEGYSKSIEVVLNGGTFEQAYLSMKIQTDLIVKFYFQNERVDFNYKVPPQLYGIPDAHPLMVLLLGSESDVFRVMHYGSEEDVKTMVGINELLACEPSETGIFKQFVMSNSVNLNEKLKNLLTLGDKYISGLPDTWPMKNVNFKNTAMNTVQFLMKLKDRNFVAALQDDTVVRRISRAYFGRSHMTTNTSFGFMSPKSLKELIMHIDMSVRGVDFSIDEEFDNIRKVLDKTISDVSGKVENYKQLANLIYSEPIALCDYMDRLTLENKELEYYHKTSKPVHIKIDKNIGDIPLKFEVNSLLAWMRYPEFRPLLPDTRGYWSVEIFVNDLIKMSGLNPDDLSDQQMFSVLSKVRNKTTCEYFCYANIPSYMRDVSSYQDVLNLLAHNSFKNTYIKGLAVRFGKTITAPMESVMPDLNDDNFKLASSFLLTLNALLKSNEDISLIMELEVKHIDSDSISKMWEFYKVFKNKWLSHRLTPYIKPLLLITDHLIEGSNSIRPELFEGCYFHSYLKRQFLVGNVWLGYGKLLVSADDFTIILTIRNLTVEEVQVKTNNYDLTRAQVEYINMSLKQSQLQTISSYMSTVENNDSDEFFLGVDIFGSYSVTTGKNIISGIRAKVTNNFDEPITDFNRGLIKPEKRGRFKWFCEWNGSRYSFLLNTLMIEPTSALHDMRSLIVPNTHNKNILASMGTDTSNVLVNLCYKDFDLELSTDLNDMVKVFKSTEIYKILRHCKVRKIADTSAKILKMTHDPSPDGGFLNCLLNYSYDVREFGFRWEHVTTPEYMQLKATQPASFMTELSDGLMEKYRRLYDNDDRSSITTSLLEIMKNMTGEVDEAKFKSLLCTWGYVGIAGALEDASLEKDAENFKSVRTMAPTDPYLSVSVNSLQWLISSLYRVIKQHLRLRKPVSNIVKATRFGNPEEVDSLFRQICLTISLYTYSKGQYIDVIDVTKTELVGVLYTIFTDETSLDEFKNELSHDFYLRQLPTNPTDFESWLVVVNTLIENFIRAKQKSINLDYSKYIQRMEEYERPKKSADFLLEKTGLKLPPRSVAHHGVVTGSFMDELLKPKKVLYRNRLLRFTFVVADESQMQSIPLCLNYLLKGPLTEDFMESDEWEEVKCELECEDPDIDNIESNIDAYGSDIYEKPNDRFVQITERGRFKSVKNIEFKVLLFFSSKANERSFYKVRSCGHDIIIISNYLVHSLFKGLKDAMFFRENKSFPKNAMIPPSDIYYTIITRFKDKAFWSDTFGLVPLGNDELDSLTFKPAFAVMNMQGRKVNDMIGGDQSNNWYIDYENEKKKAKMAEENEKKPLEAGEKSSDKTNLVDESNPEYEVYMKREKVSRMLEELKKYGLTNELLHKYREMIFNGGEEKHAASLIDMFRSYFEINSKNDVISKLKTFVESLKSSPLTPAEQEMIFQVPLIFGGGRKRETQQRSNILTEQTLISELESIAPGLIWKIISGTFRMSERWLEKWKQQMCFYDAYIYRTKSNKEGKQLLVRIVRLLLNDAKNTKRGNEDNELLDQMMFNVNKIILDDNMFEEDETDTLLDDDHAGGKVNYKVVGEKRH